MNKPLSAISGAASSTSASQMHQLLVRDYSGTENLYTKFQINKRE